MIGTNPPSHQRIPAFLGLAVLAAACSHGGGRGAVNLAPTIVTAAYVGAGAPPVAGETLLLFFSEDVALVAGKLLTDADVALSDGATLGDVTQAPALASARSISIVLGTGVAFVPGTTTIALVAANDVVQDGTGKLGDGGSAVTIGTSDGSPPTLSNVTIANIDDELNGTGPAGGTLQVPSNGWPIDLRYADNGAIDTARTQVVASVVTATPSGSQPAGTNLLPFLTEVSATNTAASYRVPANVTFPPGAATLTCVVVDASGLASAPSSFAFTVRPFTDALRPFETSANPQQVWYLDFARDVESFTTSPISGGFSVDVTATPNGRSDFVDILFLLGLQHTSPIPNVSGGQDSNAYAQSLWKGLLLAELASLYAGANVTFTLTQPGGSFGGNSSLAYHSIGYSPISIAGSPSTPGVLGVAIFDPSNATQNDDTLTDFQGIRLGIFLHTIADSGFGPPSSSPFRVTFGPFAPALGGTAIGADAQDGQRLLGTLNDARATDIDTALHDFARFVAVVLAHECGHSMGLVQNGAMPAGLYGNDSTNFPGSADGHIRNISLFPPGATNVMSPSLSYSSAIHAATAFNTLNMAYLREQVFYGN
jgi:hypothetical protein